MSPAAERLRAAFSGHWEPSTESGQPLSQVLMRQSGLSEHDLTRINAVQEQIGLAAVDRDQLRHREMRREQRLLGVLPRIHLVEIPGQGMEFAVGDLHHVPGSQQRPVFRGKTESVDDLHAVMNS